MWDYVESTVVIDLLVVQVREGETVTEGEIQHLVAILLPQIKALPVWIIDPELVFVLVQIDK